MYNDVINLVKLEGNDNELFIMIVLNWRILWLFFSILMKFFLGGWGIRDR